MQWREREMTAWPWEGQGSSAFQKRRGCLSHYHISIGRLWKSHNATIKVAEGYGTLPAPKYGRACGQFSAFSDYFHYGNI